MKAWIYIVGPVLAVVLHFVFRFMQLKSQRSREIIKTVKRLRLELEYNLKVLDERPSVLDQGGQLPKFQLEAIEEVHKHGILSEILDSHLYKDMTGIYNELVGYKRYMSPPDTLVYKVRLPSILKRLPQYTTRCSRFKLWWRS